MNNFRYPIADRHTKIVDLIADEIMRRHLFEQVKEVPEKDENLKRKSDISDTLKEKYLI